MHNFCMFEYKVLLRQSLFNSTVPFCSTGVLLKMYSLWGLQTLGLVKAPQSHRKPTALVKVLLLKMSKGPFAPCCP